MNLAQTPPPRPQGRSLKQTNSINDLPNEDDIDNHPLMICAGVLYAHTGKVFHYVMYHFLSMIGLCLSLTLFLIVYGIIIGIPFSIAYFLAKHL